MSHGITVVRGPNLDYRILGADGKELGRCKKQMGVKHPKHFFVFLEGVYWRPDNTPNRRGGSTGSSVHRLKHVPEFVEATLQVLAESDAKTAAEKKVLLERVVDVKPGDASGNLLDWLVAKALGFDVDIEPRLEGSISGPIYVPVVARARYTALPNQTLVLRLMNDCIRIIEKCHDGKYCAAGADSIVCFGESVELAVLRSFVIQKLGQVVSVPSCFLGL